jgi:hypothetical protein
LVYNCRHQGKAIDRFGVEWEKAALYFGDVFHTLLNVSAELLFCC